MGSRLRPDTNELNLARAQAGAEHVGWEELAYAFLVRYCRHHHSFIACEVTAASVAWNMIQPLTSKAWGPVYRRAAKNGIIRRIGYEPSPMRHRSPTPRWHSMICERHS